MTAEAMVMAAIIEAAQGSGNTKRETLIAEVRRLRTAFERVEAAEKALAEERSKRIELENRLNGYPIEGISADKLGKE